MKLINKKAMTLVETLVSTLIFSMIIAALLTSLAAGNAAWETYDAVIAVQRDARQSILFISKDLREASGISITQNSTSATVTFSRPIIGAVTYTWTTTGSNAKKILRENQSVTKTIANNISAFSITDNSSNLVLNVTATKSTPKGQVKTLSMKEKVALR